MYFHKLIACYFAVLLAVTGVSCSNENSTSDVTLDSTVLSDTNVLVEPNSDTKTDHDDGDRKTNQRNVMIAIINGKELITSIDNSLDENLISQDAALALFDAGVIFKKDLEDHEYEDEYGTISEKTIVHLKNITIGNSTFERLDVVIKNNISDDLILGRRTSGQISYSSNQSPEK